MINNGVCDEDWRYEKSCNFDGEDCPSCNPGWTSQLQFNSECDLECYTKTCNWDEGNCDNSTEENPYIIYVLGNTV